MRVFEQLDDETNNEQQGSVKDDVFSLDNLEETARFHLLNRFMEHYNNTSGLLE